MANDPASRVDRFHPAGNVPQPVCEDRLTVSRQRLERLALIADAGELREGVKYDEYVQAAEDHCQDPYDEESEELVAKNAYARGVRDVLIYLIDRAQLDPNLAALLDIEE